MSDVKAAPGRECQRPHLDLAYYWDGLPAHSNAAMIERLQADGSRDSGCFDRKPRLAHLIGTSFFPELSLPYSGLEAWAKERSRLSDANGFALVLQQLRGR